MPTVIRFNKQRYLASGVNLSELFDQIPEPIAYFDADDRLSACNLSFRNHFPIVIESEFLKRAAAGPVSSQSDAGAPPRLPPRPWCCSATARPAHCAAMSCRSACDSAPMLESAVGKDLIARRCSP